MGWPAAGDHGVAMVIVLWFVQDCATGNGTLKKRQTCSHAEMQSPCERVGRSLIGINIIARIFLEGAMVGRDDAAVCGENQRPRGRIV